MKYNKQKIHIILTGGTIDSYYNGTKDTAETLEHSALPEFLKSLKIDSADLIFTEICMKDSRSITEDDRKKILTEIENSEAEKIIITHGTYTMPGTARFLKANLKTSKSIVLTGSMIPLTGFSPSDAPFSLGFALASLYNIESGIYLAMNGQLFDPEEVQKLLSEGKFSSIFINQN